MLNDEGIRKRESGSKEREREREKCWKDFGDDDDYNEDDDNESYQIDPKTRPTSRIPKFTSFSF